MSIRILRDIPPLTSSPSSSTYLPYVYMHNTHICYWHAAHLKDSLAPDRWSSSWRARNHKSNSRAGQNHACKKTLTQRAPRFAGDSLTISLAYVLLMCFPTDSGALLAIGHGECMLLLELLYDFLGVSLRQSTSTW